MSLNLTASNPGKSTEFEIRVVVEVPLSQNKVALIDADDAQRVLAFKWHVSVFTSRNKQYAVTNGKYVNGVRQPGMKLHRFILNAPNGVDVDHVNGNTLDNRRANLRLATQTQNTWNAKRRRDNTSMYKGVQRRIKDGRWRARIQFHKQRIHLGYFDTPEEAAVAYDKKAIALFGEFAVLNFPNTKEAFNE